MTPFFVDTSFYVANLSPSDSYHERPVQLARDPTHSHVTTEAVLWELGNALSRDDDRHLFVAFMSLLRKTSTTKIVPADTALLNRAIDLFQKRPDKEWSLTDCASFVVMTDLGLSEALTSDHHFEQAGFHALLRTEWVG